MATKAETMRFAEKKFAKGATIKHELGWVAHVAPRRRPRGSRAPAGWNMSLEGTLAMMIGVDLEDALTRLFAASGVCCFVAFAVDEALATDDDEFDPEACPGCGCRPGDGITAGCNDVGGCGTNRHQAEVRQ